MQAPLSTSVVTSSSPGRSVRRLIPLVLGVLLILVIVGYFGLSLYLYNRVSLPQRVFGPATPTGTFEDVTYPSRGQNYLVHAFYMAGNPGAPALISVHGYNESRHSDYHLKRAQDLRALGYSVLSIDLSDNGGDTHQNGRISMGDSERWDVLGSYDYMLIRGFAPDRIGLVGESMGAATSLIAASIEPRIKAVWADSAFEDSALELDYRVQQANVPTFFMPGADLVGLLISGEKLWVTRPIDAAATLAADHQAVYIIHDQPDTNVPFQQGVDLYNAYQKAGVTVTFWPLPDHEHVEAIIYHHDEYMQRLDAFFKQALGK